MAAEERARVARIAELGQDSDYPDGTVLAWDQHWVNSATVYSYAAIKANNLWYTTGPRSPKAYTWDQLVYWMLTGEQPNGIWMVTAFEQIV
jgi:hypothetical protein